MKNKKNLLILIVLAVVVIGTVGLTYALYSRTIIGANTELVAGDIYMHYNETKEVTISNAMPSATYSEDQEPFEFNITGKNTNTDNDIWYEIVLTRGDVPEGKSEENRIDDKYLKFTLIETKSESESLPVNETVVNAKSYQDLIEGQKIWVNEIPRETTDETMISYKLYMWISDEVKVGNSELEGIDYDIDAWNNAFASVKINVNGDFTEKKIKKSCTGNAVDCLKKQADESGEIIAIDNDSNKCEKIGACEAREYRYIGPTVNNYVKLNNNEDNEIWRIIGIFKDKNNGNEEYLRLVKDKPIQSNYIPLTYQVGETTYTLKDSAQDNTVYWNESESSGKMDSWNKSGIQYYLNSDKDDTEKNKGYMSYLSEDTKNMLMNRMHYLGNMNYSFILSTAGDDIAEHIYSASSVKSTFQYERDVEDCLENTATSNNLEGCYIFSGNAATWSGKISIMYPSDFGFSTSDKYWEDEKLFAGHSAWESEEDSPKDSSISSSWMYYDYEDSWLISLAESIDEKYFYNKKYYLYLSFNTITDDCNTGTGLCFRHIDFDGRGAEPHSLHPVLNLASNVKIVSGDGSPADPYKLSSE